MSLYEASYCPTHSHMRDPSPGDYVTLKQRGVCLTWRDLLQQSRFAPQNLRLQIHRHADHQVIQTVETSRQTDRQTCERESVRFNTGNTHSMRQLTHMIWYDAQEMFLWKKPVHTLMLGQQWERDVKVCWKTLLPSLMTPPWGEAWGGSSVPVERRSADQTRHWWPQLSLEDQEHPQTSAQPAALERARAGCSAAHRRTRVRLFCTYKHLQSNELEKPNLFWENLNNVSYSAGKEFPIYFLNTCYRSYMNISSMHMFLVLLCAGLIMFNQMSWLDLPAKRQSSLWWPMRDSPITECV